MFKSTVIAIISISLFAWLGAVQNHPQARAEKLGLVHFETSCSEPAQAEFSRAVALLHSFQFADAIHGFHAALRSDPQCGIAYWGIALSNWSNPFAPGKKDQTQLRAGLENSERGTSLGARTARERAYIAAVKTLYVAFDSVSQQARLNAYRESMQRLAAKYPQDHEAQIFYALALAASEDPSDKSYAARLKAGGILESLFEMEPSHPGLAHYLIHTYDVPALAPRALAAARRYSQIAPDAPHALHMPSHTFTRTGYWQDSIDSNIAAAAAAKRQKQTAEELHATDYEIYAYLQTAQIDAARRILHSLPEIAARFDPQSLLNGAGGPAVGYFALAAIPARYALERQDWKQAAQLEVHQTSFPYTDAMTWFARGLGAARLGQVATANESATALQEIRAQLVKSGEDYWAKQVEIQQVEVSAWVALAENKNDQAISQMMSAADMEDGTEKSAVTPGPLAPARELLGQMFLQLNQPTQALKQFEATLQHEPGRFRALYEAAHAAQLTGDRQTSQKYFRQLLKTCSHGDNSITPELNEAQQAISRK
jgi:hypothetical protein